jgi:nucleotide-binding universal stress UspA family protein
VHESVWLEKPTDSASCPGHKAPSFDGAFVFKNYLYPSLNHYPMKKIAVLIDFTGTCHKSAHFAGKIAQKAGAEVIFLHIARKEDQANQEWMQDEMNRFAKELPDGIQFKIQIEYGNFFKDVPYAIRDLQADIVIVGTHGVVGIKQNLFGSNILKLVKKLAVPSLVVQDGSSYRESMFANILFPIAPHDDFTVKATQTALLAKLYDSIVHIYLVHKHTVELSPQLETNLEKTIDFFTAQKIRYNIVREDAQAYSVGYANQIIRYSQAHEMGAICIMSKVARDNYYFGYVDKENLLLNENHTPVYCANDVELEDER